MRNVPYVQQSVPVTGALMSLGETKLQKPWISQPINRCIITVSRTRSERGWMGSLQGWHHAAPSLLDISCNDESSLIHFTKTSLAKVPTPLLYLWKQNHTNSTLYGEAVILLTCCHLHFWCCRSNQACGACYLIRALSGLPHHFASVYLNWYYLC